MSEISKPRRKKKIDVPVHKSIRNDDGTRETNIRTYSAQFTSKKKGIKQKSIDFSDYVAPFIKKSPYNDVDTLETDRSSQRISRRYLKLENDKYKEENRCLSEKLTQLEEYFNKKSVRFREKFDSIQKYNEEVINENNVIKAQYQELLENFQECAAQLDKCRICNTCEELKGVIQRNNEDFNVVKTENKELTEDVNMLKTVVYR